MAPRTGPRIERNLTRIVLPALALALPLALALLGPHALAAASKTFRQASAADFEEGEPVGTTVLPAGEVVPGLLSAHIAMDAAFAWCAATSSDGASVYFGSGDAGKIFVAPARGAVITAKDAKLPPARLLAKIDAPWVTALAVRSDGKLLAATTPGGQVHLVDPKTGHATLLAKVPAEHVWALVRDDKARATYAATGIPGKVVAIDDNGGARELWDAHDKHVVALYRDADGTLLAGTSDQAILYRVQPDGRAEVMQDFEAEEVRAITRTSSGLFVAVNDFDKPPPLPPTVPAAAPAKGTKVTVSAGGPPSSAGALPRPGTRKSKAAVYRFESQGRVEQVFALGDGYLTALAGMDDGSVVAASGTEGRVFRVSPDRTSALVLDLPERQALSLARAGDVLLVGTGDVGGIYRAAPAPKGEARYVSKVLDADYLARWGILRWQGRGVSFETRSGNTAKPDTGWHAWTPLGPGRGAEPARDDGGAGEVKSPGGRYLQYRATLASPAGRLLGVTTSYLPQNQRARVTELTLADAAGAGAGAASSGTTVTVTLTPAATTGSAAAHSPVLKLRWKVDNPDGDELIYRLTYREQSEPLWRPLAGMGDDPLTKPEYDWNTEGFPDGNYIVRVTTSDERAQPHDRALSSDFDSLPLLVDNRKPEVVDLKVHLPTLSGLARDDASPITQIEYSLNGKEWRVVSPADGIADELREAFSINLPPLGRGTHAVAVRATDSADNVGVASILVKAP